MAYGGTGGERSTLLKGTLKRAPSAKKGKRPCKYGPRTSAGKCPKKPASARPPCKYGPRTAKGLCPKKPKSFRSAVTTDLKAGRTPLSTGSSSRTVAVIAGEQAATRAVTRSSRKLESYVKKNASRLGPAAALLARALAPVAAIIALSAFADSRFNALRARDIDHIAGRYRRSLLVIPPNDGGKFDAARNRQRVALAKWLGDQLAAINDRYDKRPIDER